MAAALRILGELGVQLHPQKTRIVHVRQGFEFLGYKIKRGPAASAVARKIRSTCPVGALYAYPREKSIQRFMDQVRQLTKPTRTADDQGVDRETKSVAAGMGALLQAGPRPKALQPAGPLGRASDLVASFSAAGETAAGNRCRNPCCTGNTGL